MALPGSVEFILKARDEATREIQRVSGSLGGLTASVGRLTSTMGALGAASVSLTAIATGAFAAAKAFGDMGERLDRESKLANTTAANMQALELAFEQAGLSGADAASMMAELAKSIGENDPLLAELGITTRDVFQAFLQLAEILGRMPDAGDRAVVSQKLLGRAMKESSGIVAELGAQVAENIALHRRFGATMDADAMAAAKRLDKGIDDLKGKFDASANALRIRVAPALIQFIDLLNKAFDAAEKLKIFERLPGAAMRAFFGPVVGETFNRLLAGRTPGQASAPRSESASPASGPPVRLWSVETMTQLPGASERILAGHNFTTMGVPQTFQDFNSKELASIARDAHERLDKLVASMRQVPVPTQVMTDTFYKLKNTEEIVAAFSINLSAQMANDIRSIVSAFVTGTATISQSFSSLIQSMAEDLLQSAVELGIGMALQGFPGGSFLNKLGKNIAGNVTSAPAGDTYYVSTLNAKDLIQELMSPTGQLRQANDRIYDISRAARA